MLPDEKEWTAVNQHLRQLGLSPIIILNEINVNDYVWLTLEASRSLRLTIKTLIDDCHKKQYLVQELMTSNADLREQLKLQSSKIDENEHIIEQVRTVVKSQSSHKIYHSNSSEKINVNEANIENMLDVNNEIKDIGAGDNFNNKVTATDYFNKDKPNLNYMSNSISKTLLNSETHTTNSNKYKNKIKSLQLEINTLKREQKSNVAMAEKNIETIFKELNVSDLQSAVAKIRSNTNKRQNTKSTKQFISDIFKVIHNVDGNISNKHDITCDKSLQDLKSIISTWANQITSIPELANQINMLLLTLIPHKYIRPIDPSSTIVQMVNHISDLPQLLKVDCAETMVPVKDEKVSDEQIRSIIEYIQMLFGIKSVKGVYAGTNAAYRRLSEQENMIRQLKSILSLDENASCSKLFAAVSSLCQREQVADNRLENEVQQLTSVIETQERCISVFKATISDLQSLLGVESVDCILDEIKRLVERRNELIVD